MKPAVGKIVMTTVNPNSNAGVGEAPAMVTAVNEVEGEDTVTVNLTVFLNGSEPLRLTNVEFFETRSSVPDDSDEDKDPELTATGEPVTSPPIVKRQAFPLPR